LVAGGEGGLALGSQGGSEAVGIGESVIGAKFGGGARQVEAGFDDFDGELRNVLDDFTGDAGAVGAPSGVVDFAPVDHGHEEVELAGYGLLEKGFDFGGAGAVFEEGHYSAGV